MDYMMNVRSSDSPSSELFFPSKLKKKGKKTGRKNKKLAESPLKSKIEEEGLNFSHYFVSKPEIRILYKEISESYEQWLSWQRKILLCGLTDKCSKSLVRTMATVVEPLLHASVQKFQGPTNIGNDQYAASITDYFSRLSLLSADWKVDSLKQANMHKKFSSYNGFNTELETIKSSDTSCTERKDEEKERNLPQSSFLPSIFAEAQVISGFVPQLSSTIHCHEDLIDSAPSKSFFPDVMLSRSGELGKICAAKSIFKLKKQKDAYTSRTFKNRKWWPLSAPRNAFLVPSGRKLLQNFKDKLDLAYEWFSNWTDAEQGACILQILSISQADELEYFSHCIIQRLKDRADINRLPDELLLRIFRSCTADEVVAASLVCKRWNSVATNQDLWRNKCLILGAENGLPNVVGKIESAGKGCFIDWKIAYRDLFLKLQERELERNTEEFNASEIEECSEDDDDEDSYVNTGDWNDEGSMLGSDEELDVIAEDESEEESSTVSGMSEYLNGNLAMIEDTIHQLSSKNKRKEDSEAEEDTALDIRPDMSVQASNKLLDGYESEDQSQFKFMSVDGIRSLKRVRKLQGHLDGVLAVQFDRKRVFSGSADRTIRVWDVRSGRGIRKLKGHKGGVRSLCFDKEHIFSGSWDTTIFVWNAIKFNRITTLIGHKDCVSCLDNNDEILISGSHDKTIKLWDKVTWTCLRTMKGHQGCVMCLCLLEDGTVLSGSMDRTVRLWDSASGSCLKSFQGSKETILSVQCCGDLVAAGAQDGNLLFWDINTGKCEAIILAHNGPLHSLSFSGARFVTGGGDQLVKEWDLSTCCCLRSLTGHKDVVLCVQASSRRIVSGSADGTVRIWDFGNHVQKVA